MWCDPSAVCAQAFLLREAEAMVGEPDPHRVMVWFTNRRTKYKKVHGVLPVRILTLLALLALLAHLWLLFAS